jgi:hypothetical protein
MLSIWKNCATHIDHLPPTCPQRSPPPPAITRYRFKRMACIECGKTKKHYILHGEEQVEEMVYLLQAQSDMLHSNCIDKEFGWAYCINLHHTPWNLEIHHQKQNCIFVSTYSGGWNWNLVFITKMSASKTFQLIICILLWKITGCHPIRFTYYYFGSFI